KARRSRIPTRRIELDAVSLRCKPPGPTDLLGREVELETATLRSSLEDHPRCSGGVCVRAVHGGYLDASWDCGKALWFVSVHPCRRAPWHCRLLPRNGFEVARWPARATTSPNAPLAFHKVGSHLR